MNKKILLFVVITMHNYYSINSYILSSSSLCATMCLCDFAFNKLTVFSCKKSVEIFSLASNSRLENVTTIEAKHCSIRKIPQNAFINLENVKVILLSYNNIDSLSEGLFNNLVNLEDLQLDNNQLNEIPRDLFKNIPNLESLYLFNNKISQIAQNTLYHLFNLKFLALDHNRINQIPDDSFDNLNNLVYLGLSSNQISEIPNGIFKNLVNLQILSLSYNQIRSLPDDLFKSLSNLEELYLNNNKISSLPKGAFDNLKNLQSLSLSGNLIKTMELWPTVLPNIKFINLTYNEIEKFSNEHGWFLNGSSNLPALSAKIDLQFNKISSLDDNTIEQYGVCSYSDYVIFIYKYFKIFNINNNPLICNCENSKQLIGFVRNHSELKNSPLLNSNCMLPSVYAGKSLTNFDSCESSIDYSRCKDETHESAESITVNDKLVTSTMSTFALNNLNIISSEAASIPLASLTTTPSITTSTTSISVKTSLPITSSTTPISLITTSNIATISLPTILITPPISLTTTLATTSSTTSICKTSISSTILSSTIIETNENILETAASDIIDSESIATSTQPSTILNITTASEAIEISSPTKIESILVTNTPEIVSSSTATLPHSTQTSVTLSEKKEMNSTFSGIQQYTPKMKEISIKAATIRTILTSNASQIFKYFIKIQTLYVFSYILAVIY